MGIFEKIGIGSSSEHLLEGLSDIAGKYQAVAERMSRHAEQCNYPAMKIALERLAAKEAEHAKALADFLAQHHRWARLVELQTREGSNNWERITGDFTILAEASGELGHQATHWNVHDPDIGERFQAIVGEDTAIVAELRKLALRADPQALD